VSNWGHVFAYDDNDSEIRNMTIHSVLVVGTGAIGALYGGMLSRAGVSVSTVVRSDYSTVVSNGFQITSEIFGDFVFRPDFIHRDVCDHKEHPDVILICGKTITSYVDMIRPVVGPQTMIVLLQNGIGIETPYQIAFPSTLIVSGLAFVCVSRTAPGVVQHLDYGRLVLGVFPSGKDDRVDTLVQLFASVGVPAKLSETVARDRWRKLVWNAPFNPLSALLGQTTDQILSVPELCDLCRGLMSEVVDIAASQGFRWDDDVVDRNIADTLKMAPYKTSMLLDVEAGRPIERISILEAPIAVAHEAGVPVPLMTTINALLKGKFN